MDSLLDTEELLALLLARIRKGEALLQSEINVLMSIGKFLSLWDCSTGLPVTNPPGGVPYTYKTGDYYRVKIVDEDTNYKPSGSQYTGEASTDIETDDVIQYATYFFDGTEWILLNASATVLFEDIEGNATDNISLANALNGKVDKVNFSGTTFVYGADSTGQNTFTFSANVVNNACARRTNTGTIKASSPVESNDCTTKSYADALVANTVTYSGTTTAGSFSDTIIVQGS